MIPVEALKDPKKRIWLVSVAISCAIITLFFVTQQMKHEVSYPLGWDQPVYVHEANRILEMGIIPWIQSVRVLDLYWAFPAYIGALINNTQTAVILIEIIQSSTLAILFSILSYRITNSPIIASSTALLYPFLNNSVQLFVLPREAFALILLLSIIIFVQKLYQPLNIKKVKTWLFGIAFLILFLWNITNAAFVVVLFSIICIMIRNKTLILNFLTLFGISAITTLILSYAFFGGYKYEVTYWTPMSPTISFFTSKFIQWTGGSILLFSIAILGLIMLWTQRKKINLQSKTTIVWSIITLTLFFAGFLTSPFINEWYVYVDRALLLFPIQLLLPIGLSFLSIGTIKFLKWGYKHAKQ